MKILKLCRRYKAVWSVESQPKFQRNTSPPSSESNIKLSKKAVWKQLASRFLARFILRPWRWMRIFFRNFGWFSVDYIELYPRRQNSSYIVEGPNCISTKSALKNVFSDVELCRSYVNRRLGGKYRLHLQGRRIPESQKTTFFIVTAVKASNLT
jgi:hypothetical protein